MISRSFSKALVGRAIITGRGSFPIRLGSNSALAPVEETNDSYGNDYGAGPSRLPYESRLASPSSPPPKRPNEIHPHSHSSPRRIRYTAQPLREALESLTDGHHATLPGFASSIPLNSISAGPNIITENLQNPNQQNTGLGLKNIVKLSTFECHVILHYLIRKKRGLLAAALITEIIGPGLNDQHCRKFRNKTMLEIFSSIEQRVRSTTLVYQQGSKDDSSSSIDPIIREQSSPPPTLPLTILLQVLESLQKIRHHRHPKLYDIVVERCCREKLPDLAAKVFVGLVEEWIVEGRLAESQADGVRIDDFYHGGGPPRDPPRTQVKSLKKWFKGVRTWCLPGETLSPHDRLDLWHPRHISLKEKLRNFPLPLPTSPPSVVPSPTTRLLKTILQSLQLDPSTTPLPVFAASVRAAAILANTVLSRTLPMGALPALLKTFRSIPSHPPVYPDSITVIPEDDPQAYTAYTQVHCALLSLLWSPPSYTYSAAMKEYEKNHPRTAFFKPEEERYVFPPLQWISANLLLQYGFRAVRQPDLVTRLVRYCKTAFSMGGEDPRSWNIAYRGGSLLRHQEIAGEAENSLFGSTALANPVQIIPKPPPRDVEVVRPRFDDSSLTSLIAHLTSTSQFDRLEAIIYRLIPFLGDSKTAITSSETQRLDEQNTTTPTFRLPPEPLSPAIYSSILNGLEKSGKTGLAQRVYLVAIQAEKSWEKGHAFRQKELGKNLPLPKALRLSMPFYTSMLNVWGNEARLSRREGRMRELKRGDEVGIGVDRIGWYSTKWTSELSRYEAARLMADRVYVRALGRWDQYRSSISGGVTSLTDKRIIGFKPDERFFNAYIDVHKDDWFGDPSCCVGDDIRPRRVDYSKAWKRLRILVEDIEGTGLECPKTLRMVYEEGPDGIRHRHEGRRIPAEELQSWMVKFVVENTNSKTSMRSDAGKLARKYVAELRRERELVEEREMERREILI